MPLTIKRPEETRQDFSDTVPTEPGALHPLAPPAVDVYLHTPDRRRVERLAQYRAMQAEADHDLPLEGDGIERGIFTWSMVTVALVACIALLVWSQT